MQVEFDIPNKDSHFSPGMYADVVLQVRNKQNALTIPVEALMSGSDRPSVLLLDSHNHVRTQSIQTGITEPSMVEVASGLREGDRVIVGNLAAFHDGEVVDPKLSNVAQATRTAEE
jgi:macrolide-specific efflux system membrane fusion protein